MSASIFSSKLMDELMLMDEDARLNGGFFVVGYVFGQWDVFGVTLNA